jgi:hypothetical protein
MRDPVMSSAWVMTRGMGLIGIKSTPMMVAVTGQYLDATWHLREWQPTVIVALYCHYALGITDQPPGAAHRSMTHRAEPRKLYFLSSCTSLKAERARKPCTHKRCQPHNHDQTARNSDIHTCPQKAGPTTTNPHTTVDKPRSRTCSLARW